MLGLEELVRRLQDQVAIAQRCCLTGAPVPASVRPALALLERELVTLAEALQLEAYAAAAETDPRVRTRLAPVAPSVTVPVQRFTPGGRPVTASPNLPPLSGKWPGSRFNRRGKGRAR